MITLSPPPGLATRPTFRCGKKNVPTPNPERRLLAAILNQAVFDAFRLKDEPDVTAEAQAFLQDPTMRTLVNEILSVDIYLESLC